MSRFIRGLKWSKGDDKHHAENQREYKKSSFWTFDESMKRRKILMLFHYFTLPDILNFLTIYYRHCSLQYPALKSISG